mmetsp:Transcript_13570/g.29506  ORF Transcript_13570/g.29506 Transcript_13570/m.29506 type:complete len:137 (-) Transcript_13570:243-653(-)
MSSNQAMGNASCESIVARKARGLDRNIQHKCTKGRADQLIGKNRSRRGRSCMKSKTGYQKRHRSASLSPPLYRISNHLGHTSLLRKRSKSVSPQNTQKGQGKELSLDTTDVVKDKENGWTEIPILVLTGIGFPTLV